MAAGVNYNNVWAARDYPVDLIAERQKRGEPADENFHIGGADASGIVYQLSSQVKDLKIGDEVVIHCGTWDGRKLAWPIRTCGRINIRPVIWPFWLVHRKKEGPKEFYTF